MRLSREQLEPLLINPRLSPNGKNLYALCPKCQHDEFGISLGDNHKFNCFRKKKCGFVGNIYKLLQFLGKTKEFIEERTVGDKMEDIDLGGDKVFNFELPERTPPVLWKRVFADPYFEQRGFTKREFEKYKVGRSIVKKDYVTILVEQDFKVVGYITRSTKSKEWIDKYNETHEVQHKRYDNSPHTDFTHILMGYDEILDGVTDTVILVEGFFSKIGVDRNLQLDDNNYIKCCVTFGAKVSDEQIELLRRKNITTIYLLHEADTLKKLQMNAAKLSIDFDIKVGYLPDKDPGDMNCEELLEVMENTKSWIDINKDYL